MTLLCNAHAKDRERGVWSQYTASERCARCEHTADKARSTGGAYPKLMSMGTEPVIPVWRAAEVDVYDPGKGATRGQLWGQGSELILKKKRVDIQQRHDFWQ